MDKATTIFVVRHGHRQDSEGDPPASRPFDTDITETGQLQAQETGQRLKKEGLSVVYASPFLRTTHTGAIIARECGVRLRLDWGLGEWFCRRWWSEWPGTIPSEILARMFPEIEPCEQSGFYPVLDEGQISLCARYENAARALASRHHGQKIALVTHGVAVMTLPFTMSDTKMDRDPSHRLCGVTSLSFAGQQNNDSRWTVDYTDDVSHLTFVRT